MRPSSIVRHCLRCYNRHSLSPDFSSPSLFCFHLGEPRIIMPKGLQLVNKAPGGPTSNAPAQQPAVPRAPARTGTTGTYASLMQGARAPPPQPRGPPGAYLNVPNVNNIARDMGGMNLAGQGSQAGGLPNTAAQGAAQQAAPQAQDATSANVSPAAMVPSIAPAPTLVSERDWVAPTHAGSLISAAPFANTSHGARAGWYNSGHCKMAIHKAKDFQSGDVIAAPYHVPNLNPKLSPNSKDLVISSEGPVFSKRRMGIVLWKSAEVMIVLPLFSWTSQGIGNKIQHWKAKGDLTNSVQDYVEVFNYRDRQNFKMKGVHQPLHFVHKQSWGGLTEYTTCQITGAVMVNWKEDITQVGRITRQSFNRLLQLRQMREAFYIREDARQNSWPMEGARDTRVLQKEPKPQKEPNRVGPGLPPWRNSLSCLLHEGLGSIILESSRIAWISGQYVLMISNNPRSELNTHFHHLHFLRVLRAYGSLLFLPSWFGKRLQHRLCRVGYRRVLSRWSDLCVRVMNLKCSWALLSPEVPELAADLSERIIFSVAKYTYVETAAEAAGSRLDYCHLRTGLASRGDRNFLCMTTMDCWQYINVSAPDLLASMESGKTSESFAQHPTLSLHSRHGTESAVMSFSGMNALSVHLSNMKSENQRVESWCPICDSSKELEMKCVQASSRKISLSPEVPELVADISERIIFQWHTCKFHHDIVNSSLGQLPNMKSEIQFRIHMGLDKTCGVMVSIFEEVEMDNLEHEIGELLAKDLILQCCTESGMKAYKPIVGYVCTFDSNKALEMEWRMSVLLLGVHDAFLLSPEVPELAADPSERIISQSLRWQVAVLCRVG
ncbi:uncharacterized protein MYCFIDRAFT_170633 [Pseudocercospora fijiensis CIRAD86]|uniref:Uncharacterized protein n=1 Tax=Pseudocercospora fijiensis (strain CIRAD86) TaxID=383855 RepID=N1QCB8_PSEFD|nr:uncharacterized protein MYCFIDRAFT_170633 [Pseudocercospora fijiensis CIRAD86]EME89122.1 hypothetical protein MYCFIDRAFT_170633 [Pseudocercospora fijiensis CIRAD86]